MTISLQHSEQNLMDKTDNVEDPESVEGHTDPIEVKKVLRKIDYRLLPMLMALYTITFLDRVNIGNARLWNMEKDLHMKSYQYNIAVMVFYVPLIIFEVYYLRLVLESCTDRSGWVPSNMLLNRIKPRYYISGLCMGWGLTMTFMGFTKSYASLVLCRVLIGVFEAGMLPGCIFILGTWYKRHELLTRVSWLFVSNDIAGTISGLLGAGLGSIQGTGGYSGWQWIFFIEGAITCSIAILSLLFLLPFPEQSSFLHAEEKEWLLRRLQSDDRRQKDEKMGLKGTLEAIIDWKVICTGWLYLSVTVAAYAISIFQPTILKTFGWSDVKSNLLSAPVRIASGIFSVFFGIWSDKIGRRGPFCVFGFTIAIVGNILVMVLKGGLRYLGIYLAAIGTYICQPLVLTWGMNQVVGQNKRGVMSGFGAGFGQIGGIIASLIFPKKDEPQYYPGVGTCIGFSFTGILAAFYMRGSCWLENKAREQGKRDHLRDLPEEDQAKLGEMHPDFRYTL